MSSTASDSAKAADAAAPVVVQDETLTTDLETSSYAKESGQGGSVAMAVASEKREVDRKLLWKIDLYLMVPFVFLNFLSLMGRTNIGAALIQKLPQDLHLDAMAVFVAIAVPGAPLILFEIPSNLLMRWLETKFNFSYMKYLSIITILLGTSQRTRPADYL